MNVKKKLKIFAWTVVVLSILFIYYKRVSDVILQTGDAQAEAVLTSAAYSCIGELHSNKNAYGDFFSFLKGDNGEIACVITDGIAVNTYTSELVEKVCTYLEKDAERGFYIPCGVFTGVKLLSGFGSLVNFKLIKIVSAKCEILSSFESAGINQVKHSVYVKLMPDVTLKAVGRSKSVNVEVSVLLYENVIIGKVPEVYMGINSVGSTER